ncbi:MAG: ribonuclease HI family protein [Candidatus Curtissbacteria bacterium]|nr:ribonuclease HI family protein [Candidatus Curtissbacteria bacterium]
MNDEPITIFTDGGSRGNPGQAAYGFVVKTGGKNVKEAGGILGVATNNFAEYTAVIRALEYAKEKFAGRDIKFYMDSNLVASQLSGLFKIKNAVIRELVFKVRQLESSFGQITYTHVPREKNKEADAQVNLALDQDLR